MFYHCHCLSSLSLWLFECCCADWRNHSIHISGCYFFSFCFICGMGARGKGDGVCFLWKTEANGIHRHTAESSMWQNSFVVDIQSTDDIFNVSCEQKRVSLSLLFMGALHFVRTPHSSRNSGTHRWHAHIKLIWVRYNHCVYRNEHEHVCMERRLSISVWSCHQTTHTHRRKRAHSWMPSEFIHVPACDLDTTFE